MTGPATNEEISALIHDLSDPSYEKRVFATRRLCAIGVEARDMLAAAAGGDDVEAALRARQVLSVLDRLWFAGAEVSLAVSKTRTAWDEPVDLHITVSNRSKYPTRVPFEIDATKRASLSTDALQVGDMLDIADWLKVRSSEGREIELRVDDITADPAVTAAVQERLNGGPNRTLGPGEEVVTSIRAFNRGWARYALLDGGEHSFVFDYVPEWEDEALGAARVGRVVSNKVKIAVVRSAPEAISRGGTVASLTLIRESEELVALLVNKTDQLMLVNRNFGVSPPFAEGRWVYTLDDSIREVPIILKPRASWHDFEESLLVSVQPGQDLELSRIKITGLHKLLSEAGADLSGDRWTVHFGYSNMCDHVWQARQGPALLGNKNAPPIFRMPLSRLILSARHASNALEAPKAH
jgi:hypothetical protein